MGSFFAITEESNEVLVSRMLDHFQLHMEFSLHLTPFFKKVKFFVNISINGLKIIYSYHAKHIATWLEGVVLGEFARQTSMVNIRHKDSTKESVALCSFEKTW